MYDPTSTNPSHTQLAKDYSKHPLAIRLAEVAVKDIATIMHQVWFEGKNDFKTHSILLSKASGYLSHPLLEGNTTGLHAWSDDLIKQWWSKNPKAVSPKSLKPHEH